MGSTNLVGREVDRYDVGELLGQGGFGAVYRARHRVLGTEVALKVLWPDRADDPTTVQRFLQEARAAAAIGSPHIVEVSDAGQTTDGVVYIAMELLEGRDLSEELRIRGSLPIGEAIEIVAEILEGLTAAHEVGVIHRDLKPGNVFLADVGGGRRAKLLDFGISKMLGGEALTAEGAMLGTPHYMAPEQLEASPSLDHRADLFAVGCIFYKLITSQVPIPGDSYEVILKRVNGMRPPDIRIKAPLVSDALADLIMRSLAIDPDARWPSAREMRAALIAVAENRSGRTGSAPSLSTIMSTTPSMHPSSVTPPSVTPPSMTTPSMTTPSIPLGSATAPSVPPVSMTTSVPPRSATTTPSMPPVSMTTPSTPPPRTSGAPSWHPSRAPSAPPRPHSHPPTSHRPPAPTKPALNPLALIGLAGLAIVLAGGVGVLGVLAYRLYARPASVSTPPTATNPIPVSVEPEPTTPVAIPVPVPVPTLDDEPVSDPDVPTADRVPGPQVRYSNFSGRGSRAEVEALIARAIPELRRCAADRPLHLVLNVMITGPSVGMVTPHPFRRSDDRDAARCAGEVIREAGPVRFGSGDTAVMDLDIDLPATGQ